MQIGHVIHPGTGLTANIRTTKGKSVHGTQTPFTLDGVSSTTNVTLGSNIYFTEPKLVASEINETNEMSGSKSFVHNITISSTNARLSPVIDLKRVNADFELNNDVNFKLDNQLIEWKSGDKIGLFFSYRYTTAKLQEILSSYGINMLNYWESANQEEGVYLCQKSI